MGACVVGLQWDRSMRQAFGRGASAGRRRSHRLVGVASIPSRTGGGKWPRVGMVLTMLALAACGRGLAADPTADPFALPAGPGGLSISGAPAAGSGAADTGRGAVSHRPDRGHLTIAAEADSSADGRLTVSLRLEPDEHWHLYPVATRDAGGVGTGKPTLLAAADEAVAARVTAVATAEPGAADGAAVRADFGVEGPEGIRILPGTVAFRIEIATDAAAAGPVALLVGFQTCNDTTCDPPWAARLTVTPGAEGTLLSLEKARYAEVVRLPAVEAKSDPAGAAPGGESSVPAAERSPRSGGLSLGLALAMGLAGGLILNLMPCVLPVLGLKLMSFAQSAGRDRAEVFQTNLWYVAGLYAVFFVLATASVAANLGLGGSNLAWGEQFTSTRFNIVMCSIVFAFALSFLGVWELPIPGFIGEKAGHVQSQEGPLGSFLKGVLSTVLATPCSGPFLGPVFGFTLSQPTIVTYAVFGAIATGMALPYLLVGFFPGVAKALPRPGAWMETLKEILGFVMLGTVVFLFTFLDRDYFTATLGLLFGIWAGCWWVGKAQERVGAVGLSRWLAGAAVAATIGAIAMTFLGPVESIIPWEPFSRARLAELRRDGRTVLVDFSADWCLTCKLNLATAIETRRVKAAIEANHVVPLLADWTEESDEIKLMLESLESKSIPVLAVFPAGAGDASDPDPIVLRDLLTESQVLDALETAGPSRPQVPELRSGQTSTTRSPPAGSEALASPIRKAS
jgi:thiol:disulfide interchange protein